jgi:hypothetical protein
MKLEWHVRRTRGATEKGRCVKRFLQVIGVAAAVLLVMGALAVSYASTRRATTMVGVVVAHGGASIEATDQLGVQGALTVDRVVAPDASWVAVYNKGMGGMPSTRVGLVRVPAGESRDISIPLDTSVRLTESVMIVLVADRGTSSVFEYDPKRFDTSTDKPYWVDGKQVRRYVWVRFAEMANSIKG